VLTLDLLHRPLESTVPIKKSQTRFDSRLDAGTSFLVELMSTPLAGDVTFHPPQEALVAGLADHNVPFGIVVTCRWMPGLRT
jgi:hypothetical protein